MTGTTRSGWFTSAAVALLVVGATGAPAAEVRVISAGAMGAIVTEMSRACERETGNTVTLAFGTVGVVRPRDLQKVTTYPAGVAAKSGSPDLARGFIAFLARPAFKAKFAAAGRDYRERGPA
jgi:ABC-type molybdate transport system substrate-binding protein